MNYTETEKLKIKKIISDLDLKGVFTLSDLNESQNAESFVLKSVSGGKTFKVLGCFPLLFCNSNRHTLLMSKQDALFFLNQEKIEFNNISLKGLCVDLELSSLKIETELFNITLYPNKRWGWALQFDDENYLLEALEFGGIEIVNNSF